jgi:hypothetical protein
MSYKAYFLFMSLATYVIADGITQIIPNVTPDIQWAVEKLQQCEQLNKEYPKAHDTLTNDLPMVAMGTVKKTREHELCAKYYPNYHLIIINLKRHEFCGTLRETIAHELLHHVGIHHHNDESLLYTHFDDVHTMLKSCLKDDYHKKTYTPKSIQDAFYNNSPFIRRPYAR